MNPINLLANRSAVRDHIDRCFHGAERAVGVTVLPSVEDTRRWIALSEAMGDLSAELARGHADIDDQIAQVCAQGQEWLERRLADRQAAPVTDLDFP
jgi:phage shock protein A